MLSTKYLRDCQPLRWLTSCVPEINSKRIIKTNNLVSLDQVLQRSPSFAASLESWLITSRRPAHLQVVFVHLQQLVSISKQIDATEGRSERLEARYSALQLKIEQDSARDAAERTQNLVERRQIARDLQPQTAELQAIVAQYSEDTKDLEEEIDASRSAMEAAQAAASDQAEEQKSFAETCRNEIAAAEESGASPDPDYIDSRYRAIIESQEACLLKEQRVSEAVDKLNILLDKQERVKLAMKAKSDICTSRILGFTRQFRNLTQEAHTMGVDHQNARAAQTAWLDSHGRKKRVLAERLSSLMSKRLSESQLTRKMADFAAEEALIPQMIAFSQEQSKVQ